MNNSAKVFQIEIFVEICQLVLSHHLFCKLRQHQVMFFSAIKEFANLESLREKCPSTELFVVRIFLYAAVNLRIQAAYRKIRTRKNSVFGHFSRTGYVLQSLCSRISKGLMNTGGWFVALFSNFKFLYIIIVRLTLSSNILNVGSAQNLETSWGLMQNWTNSSNWQSDGRTTRESGCTLHSLIKMDHFAMLSSLFPFWSNIHTRHYYFHLHFLGYSTDGDPKK